MTAVLLWCCSDTVEVGLAGVAITYCIGMVPTLEWLVQFSIDLESRMNTVERLLVRAHVVLSSRLSLVSSRLSLVSSRVSLVVSRFSLVLFRSSRSWTWSRPQCCRLTTT